MNVLAVLLAWLGVTSAFLPSQAPGRAELKARRRVLPGASSTSASTPSRGLTARPTHCVSLAASASSTPSTPPPSGDDDQVVQFRAAFPEEDGAIRRILAGMLMNPMSIDVKNFVCAEKEGLLVGFGQVRCTMFSRGTYGTRYVRLYNYVTRYRWSAYISRDVYFLTRNPKVSTCGCCFAHKKYFL